MIPQDVAEQLDIDPAQLQQALLAYQKRVSFRRIPQLR
jgi:hypothetical protein